MGGVHLNLLSRWKKRVHLSEVFFMGNMGWPLFFQWYHEDHEEFRDAKIIFEVRVGVMEVVGCWEA